MSIIATVNNGNNSYQIINVSNSHIGVDGIVVKPGGLIVTNNYTSDLAYLAAKNLITITPVTNSTALNKLVTFHQVATTSAVQLPSNTLSQGITLNASSSNSGTIYIGGPGVTATTGSPLAPGTGVTLTINNSNQIYMVGVNTSDVLVGIGS